MIKSNEKKLNWEEIEDLIDELHAQYNLELSNVKSIRFTELRDKISALPNWDQSNTFNEKKLEAVQLAWIEYLS